MEKNSQTPSRLRCHRQIRPVNVERRANPDARRYWEVNEAPGRRHRRMDRSNRRARTRRRSENSPSPAGKLCKRVNEDRGRRREIIGRSLRRAAPRHLRSEIVPEPATWSRR